MTESESPALRAWPLWLRILFWFSFCYFLLYTLPESGRVSLFGTIPRASRVIQAYTSCWHFVCPCHQTDSQTV